MPDSSLSIMLKHKPRKENNMLRIDMMRPDQNAVEVWRESFSLSFSLVYTSVEYSRATRYYVCRGKSKKKKKIKRDGGG
jgi:hypothetical protein